MIRLAEAFRTDASGNYSPDVYRANLAIVEGQIKGLDEITVNLTSLERESLLKPSGDGSAVDDYTEMLLQFGCVFLPFVSFIIDS